MKGVHLFKSHITKSIYEEFLIDLKFKKTNVDSTPFVLVDPETGEITLLAGSLSNEEGEYNAISVEHRNQGQSQHLLD